MHVCQLQYHADAHVITADQSYMTAEVQHVAAQAEKT